jgi:DNA transformation protein
MDRESIEELFQALGPVTIRRMFGGKGIYCDGRIFALEFRGDILLKADGESAPDFEAAGSRQWTYEGKRSGRPVKMPYWTIPDEALDDPDVMAEWARRAYAAALRST